jgi:vitamin B12 transporter
LKEETSKGFEIGLEFFASEQLNLETVIFVQEIEDAIYFDLSGFSGYLQDIGKSTSEGVELSGNYTLDDQWELSANYTYNETERPNGSQRLRRPERLANLGISYRNNKDRLRVHFFYRISRNSIDEVFGSAIPLDDFEVLDLTASYQVSERLELYGRIENGLNESYSEVTDFLAPERASYLGLRVNF